MDFITQFLARVFEQFKLRNPTAAGGILLFLIALTHTAHQGTLLGLYELPEWASGALQFIGLFLTAVIGANTYRYLPPDLQKLRDEKAVGSGGDSVRYFGFAKHYTAKLRGVLTAKMLKNTILALPRGKI